MLYASYCVHGVLIEVLHLLRHGGVGSPLHQAKLAYVEGGATVPRNFERIRG